MTLDMAKDACLNTVIGYMMALEAYAPTQEQRQSAAIMREMIHESLSAGLASELREQDESE